MKKGRTKLSGITDRFCIIVKHLSSVYECKVDEFIEANETYYHLDVLSPFAKDMDDHIRQNVYHIEMRIDCTTNQFKINTFNQQLPDELIKIEQKLSDALCARH